MSWFDILKEPLISVPKSIVSMKKPKKVETREECKEKLKKLFRDVFDLKPQGKILVSRYYTHGFDDMPEEVACKVIELLKKEANNKDYADGGVSYQGRFPEVREQHGNMPRLEDVGEYSITVEFAKFDMAAANRDKIEGRLLIVVDNPEDYTICEFYAHPRRLRVDDERVGEWYDDIKAVIP